MASCQCDGVFGENLLVYLAKIHWCIWHHHLQNHSASCQTLLCQWHNVFLLDCHQERVRCFFDHCRAVTLRTDHHTRHIGHQCLDLAIALKTVHLERSLKRPVLRLVDELQSRRIAPSTVTNGIMSMRWLIWPNSRIYFYKSQKWPSRPIERAQDRHPTLSIQKLLATLRTASATSAASAMLMCGPMGRLRKEFAISSAIGRAPLLKCMST